MWDERYATREYIYGTQPNDFLRDNYASIPEGRVLSLAEGEGRNAVFLVKQGYDVTAVDGSAVALRKAEEFADAQGVTLTTVHADLAEYPLGVNQWDGIISIFCPLPSTLRARLHRAVVEGLRPGGVFLLEAYTPDQIRRGTGGGNDPDTMPTAESLRDELAGLTFTHLAELQRDVMEGKYHTGRSAVVQAIAVK